MISGIKWFMIPYGGRRFSIVNPVLFLYVVFDDGRYIPTGPTMAEMWLNKAEALARKGIWAAHSGGNTLRAQRMNTSAPLTAIDAADALTQILQERRREMPFSMRWLTSGVSALMTTLRMTSPWSVPSIR